MASEGGLATSPSIEVDQYWDYVPAMIVGPQLQEIGEQVVAENNDLPVESMPIITENIIAAIQRLQALLAVPGTNKAEIRRKIGLLTEANGHIAEAAAGLAVARNGYATYLGDAAMTDVGYFRF